MVDGGITAENTTGIRYYILSNIPRIISSSLL